MNVRLTMIAHLLNIVKTMNAETPVLTLFVAVRQIVKLKHTEQYVNVLLVCKATHWFLARKLDVLLALNVLTMKNVIILHHHQLEKSVNHCAGEIHVLKVLLVQQIITEKSVLVTTLFKETAIYHVQNVRSSKYLLI